MATVLIALGSIVLYLVAYHTYGRYLARRIFRIEPARTAPAVELQDGVDYVPSRRDIVFGHHFTSIAGTGPIVGPAVAVVWGWVPALVWVVLGSIVMGAVHDFGSLIISMRHKGRTIADLASDVVGPRVRLLFLLVVLLGLWIVLAVFGLVIATVFRLYPSCVVPVFAQIPIAIALGLWIRRGGNLILATSIAAALMYGSIAWAASVDWSAAPILGPAITAHISETAFWTLILLVYVFIASVLPVQWLLQPRDYINSWQLLIAMALLVLGILATRPEIVADALVVEPLPAREGARVPAFFPFLFVTVACGAISGFHCLVASGCASRQLKSEADAQYVGYGAMLTEGFLAVLVIIACVAGIGLGTAGGLTGVAAWKHHYATWGGDGALGAMLAPFVTGSANMMETLGISHALAIAIMGVFVASFAATTLDTATRLQRYVISELVGHRAGGVPRAGLSVSRVLGNRYAATAIAVLTAGALALSDAPRAGWTSAGRGGLLLWPVFGATNQLLAGLALLVITIWLVRARRPAWVTALPMTFMLVMTGWAIFELARGFLSPAEGQPVKTHLLVVSIAMLVLELWIVGEAIALAVAARGRRARPPA